MKVGYAKIEEYDRFLLYRHDGIASVCLSINTLEGVEWCSMVIGKNNFAYLVSLNPKDPIEDQDIPEEDQKIIQKYIEKCGGYDRLIELTQNFYNERMSVKERNDYRKNDIRAELQL